MPTNSDYSIEVTGQLIKVNLTGKWTLVQDLVYVTELINKIEQVKSAPWAICVDMRNCQAIGGDAEDDAPSLSKVEISRRNQAAECWIVNNVEQGKSLEKILRIAGIPLRKCLDESSARYWLKNVGFTLK